MTTYYIQHIHCGMTQMIHGYDFYDACRRAKLDPNLWEVTDYEYED